MARSTASPEKVEASTAKLFRNGRSQAVRLPKDFRFEGDEVRIRRVKRGVLLEPISTSKRFDVDAWFAEFDELNKAAGDFMPGGRKQPRMPVREFGF
jgi:antitoxin VapB